MTVDLSASSAKKEENTEGEEKEEEEEEEEEEDDDDEEEDEEVDENDDVDAVEFESLDHTRFLLSQLVQLRHDSRLCDVTLVAEGKRINANRNVLAAFSNYFKAMFTSDMVESRSRDVEMVDMKASSLEALVDFCYTGKITINDKNVLSILQTADVLQLVDVQKPCCEFLTEGLEASNCWRIREFAVTYGYRELLRCADKCILENFQDIVGTEEFYRLPFEQLFEIISSEGLSVPSEEQVFEAVVQWVKFDLKNRKQFLSKLMEHVRLPLCQPKFLVNTVSKDALVKADSSCRDFVGEAKDFLLLQLSEDEPPNVCGPRTQPRKVFTGDILYVVGGFAGGESLASVEYLDFGEENPKWQLATPMSKQRGGAGVAVLNDILYAVGGCCGTTYFSCVERFDPVTNRWSADVAPLSKGRAMFGMAEFDGFLYAVGGYDGEKQLNIVERYDAWRNEWTPVAPMGTSRSKLSVSVLKDCLYAIGGWDGRWGRYTVERLDPRVGKWETVNSMEAYREHAGSAVLDGSLYAAGGLVNWAEEYSPITNSWKRISFLRNRRFGVALAAVDGKIYAVGGCDGPTCHETVEVYDPKLRLWKDFNSMNHRRYGAGVGVIQMS